MKAIRATHQECEAEYSNPAYFGGMLMPKDEIGAFGLFRHTKQNPLRLRPIARTSLAWIGSHENYQSRLKRRWPIRFFLSIGFNRTVWEPVKRFLVSDDRAERKRQKCGIQRQFKQTLGDAIGWPIPGNRGIVFDRMMAALPGDRDFVRELDVAICLDGAIDFERNRIAKIKRTIVPRPGMGNILINEYPEADNMRNAEDNIMSYLLYLERVTMTLANKLNMMK